MLLVAADDNGRLSADRRVRHLFKVLPKLPVQDQPNFVRLIEDFGEDLVLFWHVGAQPGLTALSELRKSGSWPSNLFGVVIFRDVHFAGLADKKNSDQALASFNLDPRRVHVLPWPVSKPADKVVTNAVVRFASSLSTGKRKSPPFGQLQPAERSGAVLTLLLIEHFNQTRPQLGAELMKQAFWDDINDTMGLNLGASSPPAAVSMAAERVRARVKFIADSCSLCGRRQLLRHDATTLGKEEAWEIALPSFQDNAEQIDDLFKTAPSHASEALNTLANMLTVESLEGCAEEVRAFFQELLNTQCRLQHPGGDRWSTLQVALSQVSSAPEFQAVAKETESILQCDGQFGFRLWSVSTLESVVVDSPERNDTT